MTASLNDYAMRKSRRPLWVTSGRFGGPRNSPRNALRQLPPERVARRTPSGFADWRSVARTG